MGVIKNILLDKVHSLIDERPFASDPIAYSARWGSLYTSVAPVIQNLKEVTSESVASSCSRQDLMEENLAYVSATQQAMAVKKIEMDNRMKSMDYRQDIMGAYLRVILDLLKKP